jgi:hypothetical protein
MKINSLLYRTFAGVYVGSLDVLDRWSTDDVPCCFACTSQLAKCPKTNDKTFKRHIAKEDKTDDFVMSDAFGSTIVWFEVTNIRDVNKLGSNDQDRSTAK